MAAAVVEDMVAVVGEAAATSRAGLSPAATAVDHFFKSPTFQVISQVILIHFLLLSAEASKRGHHQRPSRWITAEHRRDHLREVSKPSASQPTDQPADNGQFGFSSSEKCQSFVLDHFQSTLELTAINGSQGVAGSMPYSSLDSPLRLASCLAA